MTVFTGPNASMSCASRFANGLSVASSVIGKERAALGVCANDLQLIASHRTPARRRDESRPLPRRRRAPGARLGEWSHPHALDRRIADLHAAESLAQRGDDVVHHPVRHDRPADRRTLLAGLRRHLAHDFLHEQVELFAAGNGVRSENRAVERVRFLVEAHACSRRSTRVSLSFRPVVGRAR